MTKNENNARLKILSSRILAFQTFKFITVRCGEIPYVGGLLGPRKVNVTCHDHNLETSPAYCINAFHIIAF